MLAHRASAQGIALAEELAGGKPWKFRAMPNCVYTDPELARGQGLAHAKKRTHIRRR